MKNKFVMKVVGLKRRVNLLIAMSLLLVVVSFAAVCVTVYLGIF